MFKKIIKIILLILLSGIVIFCTYRIVKQNIYNNLLYHNTAYMQKYIQKYMNDSSILNVEYKEYIPPIFGLDGRHFENCSIENFSDKPNKYLFITFTMEYKGCPYKVEFKHQPYKDVVLLNDGRNELVEAYNCYEGNYELLERCAKENGAETVLLSSYNDVGFRTDPKTHFIGVYVENIEQAQKLLKTFYDDVYGGYIQERQAKLAGDDMGMPRFIITNDKDIYDKMVKQSDNIKSFLLYQNQGYTYECQNSKNIKEKIMIKNIISKYLDINNPIEISAQIMEAPKYIQSDKFLLAYELEYDIDYYMNVFDIIPRLKP